MNALNKINNGQAVSNTTDKQPLTMANEVEVITTQLASSVEHDVSNSDLNLVAAAKKKNGTNRSKAEKEELYQMALPLFEAGHPHEAVALALNITPDYASKLYRIASKRTTGNLPQAQYDIVKSGVKLNTLEDGLFAGSTQLKVTRKGNALLIEVFTLQHVNLG